MTSGTASNKIDKKPLSFILAPLILGGLNPCGISPICMVLVRSEKLIWSQPAYGQCVLVGMQTQAMEDYKVNSLESCRIWNVHFPLTTLPLVSKKQIRGLHNATPNPALKRDCLRQPLSSTLGEIEGAVTLLCRGAVAARAHSITGQRARRVGKRGGCGQTSLAPCNELLLGK